MSIIHLNWFGLDGRNKNDAAVSKWKLLTYVQSTTYLNNLILVVVGGLIWGTTQFWLKSQLPKKYHLLKKSLFTLKKNFLKTIQLIRLKQIECYHD